MKSIAGLKKNLLSDGQKNYKRTIAAFFAKEINNMIFGVFICVLIFLERRLFRVLYK